MGLNERKSFIDQIRSKETWLKVGDFMIPHDPNSDKAKAIRKDVIGYFGSVPFIIGMLIVILSVTLGILLLRLFFA